MLLHGFMGSERSWDRVGEGGAFRERRVCPRLLGHGADWALRRVDSYDEEVARLLARAHAMPRPRYLCGYSMGARVALGMLAADEAAFDGAVLIGVHPGLDDEAARAERRALDAVRADAIRREGLASFVEAWESEPLFATQQKLPPHRLDVQREIRLGHDPEGLVASLRVLGLAEMPCHSELLQGLDRVVLVTGALDAKFTEIARRARTPRDPVVVQDVGHNVVLEAPGALLGIMKGMERVIGDG